MNPEDQAAPLPKVGVVVVNYNAGPHLANCVRSLQGQPIHDVVIVDNGSSDGSIDQLLAEFPDVAVVRGSNVGFGRANNDGVSRLDDACQVFALINPDTVLHDNAVEVAVQTLMSNPKFGAVGARLLNIDGSVYPSARKFPRTINAIGHGALSLFRPNNRWSRRYKRLDQNYDVMHDVDWISGAAMIIRRQAWESVGGFDHGYFMYFDDTDLCWRMREKGWRVVYEPRARITHVQGVSTKRRPYKMLKEHHRSAIRYNVKTARGIEVFFLPVLIVGLLARLPVAWLQQWRTQRGQK